MSLPRLIDNACDKERFSKPGDYIHFAFDYLEFIKTGLQAVIVSKNENNYHFFQYGKDGTYNVTLRCTLYCAALFIALHSLL